MMENEQTSHGAEQASEGTAIQGRVDLGYTTYAFLDTITYKGKVFTAQKYKSGMEIRLIEMSQDTTTGLLAFSGNWWAPSNSYTTHTDAAFTVWHDKLYIFWKDTSSHWQVWYRYYDYSDPNNPGKLIEHPMHKVTPDCHCYNYMDAVVFRNRLYLLMAVNRDNKNRIELRSTSTVPDPDKGGTLDFVEEVSFVSGGTIEVTDIHNSDTDTWDACVWHDKTGAETQELLVVGRMHDSEMTAYVWEGRKEETDPDDHGVWRPAIKTEVPKLEPYSLKLLQAGILDDGLVHAPESENGIYFIYALPDKRYNSGQIELRRFLPINKKFDTSVFNTGTTEGWLGATTTEMTLPDSKKRTQIQIISGRECNYNYATTLNCRIDD